MPLPVELSSIFRNKQKSYKMVLILSMLEEYSESSGRFLSLNNVAERFRSYYQAGQANGQKVDAPPSNVAARWADFSLGQIKTLLKTPLDALSSVLDVNQEEQTVTFKSEIWDKTGDLVFEELKDYALRELEQYNSQLSPSFSLRDGLLQFMIDYISAKSEPFASHPLGTLMRQTIPDIIRQLPFIQSQHKVQGSVGQGNWANIPWIAILDKRITDTTQHREYVVYLFSEDMSSVYLTLNQGVTVPLREKGRREGYELLRQKVNEMREMLPLTNMNKDENIQLTSSGIGRDYQVSTVAYIRYDRDNMPDEEVLLADLKNVVDNYTMYTDRLSDEGVHEDEHGDIQTGSEPVDTLTVSERVAYIKSYIQQRGFHYPDLLIENLYLSFKTKPFVILAGVSGTGKTKLVKLFAKALGATTSNHRFTLIPVRPDWSDPSDLLGYKDLSGAFRPGRLTEVLVEASRPANRYKPYFICLDEMNLARVEHYFSDLLSIMETQEWQDERIITSPLINANSLSSEDRSLYGNLSLSDNVYLIGTVNMDETTHPFSKKVLDRANTIEFNYINLAQYPDDVLGSDDIFQPEWEEEVPSAPNGFLRSDYLQLTDAYSEYRDLVRKTTERLLKINTILEEIHSHVGFRIRDAICFYMIYNERFSLMDEDAAFDLQLLQKILPRVQGSSSSVKRVLLQLMQGALGRTLNVTELMEDASELYGRWKFGQPEGDVKHPQSARKIAFMLRRLEEDGLPHTGYLNQSVELLRVETNLFNLYIQGKPYHPTVESLQLHRTDSDQLVDAHLQPSSLSPALTIERVLLFNPVTTELSPWQTGQAGFPIFFETQSYELVIEKKQDMALTFYHENMHLRQTVKPLGKTILSGILNFRNEVGLTELELRLHGQPIFQLQLEIFPSKMDYKRDYQEILADVNRQIYNLSFDFLRKTYHLTGLKETHNQSLTEFFTILEHVFHHLSGAVERIQASPHSKLRVENRRVDAAKVKKAGRENAAYLAKRPHQLIADEKMGFIPLNGQLYYPRHVLETKRVVDFDTNENRFIRWLLLRISSKLLVLKTRLTEKGRLQDPFLLKKLQGMQSQLHRLLQLDFLQVGELRQFSISLVLQMAPGYREVYRNYLMLMRGLSIQRDLFRLSMKDLAQLYEYWCFLKIHDLLTQKYELVKQDIIRVNRTGIFVTLDKTQKAKMVYRNPRNGEIFTLYYNALPKGDGSKTLSQRPDNVLTLKKNDSVAESKYIFDAKYRLNPAYEGTPYFERYRMPGPEEDDINTMHRYRDAIVYMDDQSRELERSMFGAYVLFPYHDEERFKEHKLYKSIEIINVGAFPFLPNSTTLMEKFLDEIIQDSPEKAYERSTRPRGTNHYYRSKLEGKNVVIGSLRRASQLEAALEYGFYHVPLENISDHQVLTRLEYVALYQSRKQSAELKEEAGIFWYGKVIDWKVLRRKEITEIPPRRGTEEKLYIKFSVAEWVKRETPIIPGGRGIYTLLYTSKYMFDRAREIAELRLESEEELAIWREQRRRGKVRVELDHEQVDLARRVLRIDVSEEEWK